MNDWNQSAPVRAPVEGCETRGIVVIDEHPMVAEWLAQKFRKDDDLKVCGASFDVASSLLIIRRHTPSLVLTEFSLADAPGMEVIRSLKNHFPNLPVLVFSRYDEEQCAEAAIAAGARGFVSKRECGAALKFAIRSVLAGEIYLSSRIASRVLHSFAAGKRAADPSPGTVLSKRELEVFGMIGEGFKPSEIAQKMGVGVKTVESYSTRVREKLGLENARELFRSAVEWTKRPIK